MGLSSIQIVYTFNKPQKSPDIIYNINNFLCENKSNIEIGCLYYLEDGNNDPEDIVDEMIVLKEISNNPKAGFLHYDIHKCSCLVGFYATNDFMIGGGLMEKSVWLLSRIKEVQNKLQLSIFS